MQPLSIDMISKRYGDKQVLDHFSLELPATGVVALLGPSGCGKTTLLRIIAGLERSDAGSFALPPDCKLSMVFQEDRLIPALTARDNVLAVLDGEGEALTDACLAGCGILDAANAYPDELSGGMRRRVAVARALAYGGDILLLDEPFKGLDPATKRQVMDFVFQGGHRPMLTIFVTHDADEALAAADHILLTAGPPLHVLHRFQTAGEDPATLRARILATQTQSSTPKGE